MVANHMSRRCRGVELSRVIRAGSHLQEPCDDGLGSAAKTLLLEDSVEMGSDSAVRDAKSCGDFLVAEAASDQAEDLGLPCGKHWSAHDRVSSPSGQSAIRSTAVDAKTLSLTIVTCQWEG